MEESHELSESEAADWEHRLRTADEFTRVLDESTVEVSVDQFECTDVSLVEGRVHVNLSHSVAEGDFVSVRGVLDAETGAVIILEVDDGYQSAPLAGHGTVWTYEDGEITQSRWIS